MRSVVCILCTCLVCVISGNSARASYIVDQWSLGVVIDRDGAIVRDVFTTVSMPFHTSHSVAIGGTSAAAAYDFVVNHLSIQTTQDLEGIASGLAFVQASGGIWITPQIPLTLTLSGRYNYDLNADPMRALLLLGVFDANDPNSILFNEARVFDTLFGGGMGQLAINGQITLPPNRTWVLSYTLRTSAYSGTGGSLSHANGTVDFAFAPVPEPATGVLLALAALPVLLRRRRRAR